VYSQELQSCEPADFSFSLVDSETFRGGVVFLRH
jgi:hypothetical protein